MVVSYLMFMGLQKCAYSMHILKNFFFQFSNMAVCIAEIIFLLDFQMGKYNMSIQTKKTIFYGLYDPRLYVLLISNRNTCKDGSHDHKYISLRTLPLKGTERVIFAFPGPIHAPSFCTLLYAISLRTLLLKCT